jgi:cell division protein FtsI (penicillin-binding protein 3)
LPVFKEVANRLFAINMHKSDLENNTDNDGSILKLNNMKADEYNEIASKLNLPKINTKATNWIQSSNMDSSGNPNVIAIDSKIKAIPNVIGMGLKDAIYLLENSGLKVIPVGAGKVVSQSLPKGTPITKGQTITLHLN